jgi:branched-chain amino acid transport system permease protein
LPRSRLPRPGGQVARNDLWRGTKTAVIQQLIITTLVIGSTYAILASGLALIYGVGRIINLAHTAFMMVAAYLIWFLSINHGLDFGASIAVAVVGTGLLGVLAYRFLLDRIREHHAAVLLMTIAIGMAIQELTPKLFGSLPKTIPYVIKGSTNIFGISILNQYLLTLGVATVVLIGLWLLLNRTKLGMAIRTTAQDPEVASLMGVSVSKVLMITVGIGTALAAVAGVFLPPLQGGLHQYMWLIPLMMVLVVIVLGGLGSLKGGYIASFFIGFVQAVAIVALPKYTYTSQAFAMLAMVIVLALRPQGMFGTLFEEERL